METWIIWAIFSAVTAGLYNFGFKIITEKNYDTYLSTVYSYSSGTIIALLFYLYQGVFNVNMLDFLIVLFLALGQLLFFYTSTITRVISMKNIDTVIFYPLYKTFGPICVTIISLLWFQEALTNREAFGIIIGITIPLLLITKTENKIQKNLKKGIIFVIITAFFSSISPIFIKYLNIFHFDQFLFLLLSFTLGIGLSFFGYKSHSRKNIKYSREGILSFSLILGCIHFFTFYAFVKALEGNLAVAFTINSFSILIPIILSIIFYGEHFNLKKGIVIALSIVSILLFI